jgi:hypothetical protein
MKFTAIAQMFFPLPSRYQRKILCCYANNTSQIQIARIANIANWYFERVIFPKQRFLFEALPEAELEVYTYSSPTTLLTARLRCKSLEINRE